MNDGPIIALPTSNVAGRALARREWLRWCVGAAALVIGGCKSGAPPKPTDSTIRRQAEAAQEAYSEGYVDQALVRYRQALKRAWSLDDPIEAAHASLNRAACLVSLDQLPQARAWVREARLEFARARHNDANTWLLEAKIAQQMDSPDEAWQLAAEAERIVQCNEPKPHRCPPPETTCECECVEWYQIRKYREQKKVLQRQESTIQAEVYLIRASLACDMGDFGSAQASLCDACMLLPEVCEAELRAEVQHIRGRIHLLEGRPDLAAGHFDLESELLRWAGNYREIPHVLAQAADGFEQSGDLARAADRWYRVARIQFARDELAKATEIVRRGVELAEQSEDLVVQDRYALLFHELHDAVEAARIKAESQQPIPTAEPVPSPAAPGLPPVPPPLQSLPSR